MLKVFAKYFSVGVLNTILHWAVFGFLVYYLKYNQAPANLFGFLVAVTFSFFVNAKFTFKATITTGRYILFVTFMGLLSFLTGAASDCLGVNPVFTLIIFSALSLICGFLYSKYIVFRNVK